MLQAEFAGTALVGQRDKAKSGCLIINHEVPLRNTLVTGIAQ